MLSCSRSANRIANRIDSRSAHSLSPVSNFTVGSLRKSRQRAIPARASMKFKVQMVARDDYNPENELTLEKSRPRT